MIIGVNCRAVEESGVLRVRNLVVLAYLKLDTNANSTNLMKMFRLLMKVKYA